MVTLKQKVISGLAWSAGGRFTAQLISWIVTLIVIRLLSPSDYGLMSLAMVFVGFITMLGELGLGAAIVHRQDADFDILRSLFGLVLASSVVFYLLLAFTAPVISSFFEEPRLVLIVRVLALEFILMGFSVLPRSLLQKEMEFRKLATVNFFSVLAGSTITLLLAIAGQGVWALVWGTLVIRIVSTAGFNWARPFLCLPRAKLKGVFSFFAFGGYVTLSTILWYLYTRSDKLIIGKVLGSEILGFYSVGYLLASLPMEKISDILNQVAFPAFSSVQSEPGIAGRHFLKSVRVMSFFAFPVLWGLSSIAPEVISVFLSAKWSAAALPMQIIAMVIPVRMISNLMNPAVLGVGRADISFANAFVAFALMPVAFVVGSFWGLLGVSLSWVITFPIVFCINLLQVTKVLAINFVEVLKAMWLPFLAGLIMYACVLFVKCIPIVNIQDVPKIFTLIGCGVLVYFGMTFLFNRQGLKEVRELVKV